MKIYRAWSITEQKMYFPDSLDNTENCLIPVIGFELMAEPQRGDPVMKVTGHCDTEGEYIYEGDFIKWPHQSFHYLVAWNDGESAQMIHIHGELKSDFNTLGREIKFLKETRGLPTVIGNMYANPELRSKLK